MTSNPFERRFKREREARKQAEHILETKSLELYESNQALKKLTDTLEQKVAERTQELEQEKTRALELSKAKSKFVATMSHEIRTPINGVIGALQLLESELQTEECHRLLDIANHSAGVLLHVINDILDFSKIEAGQMEVESIPFNLKNQCENALHIHQEKTHNKPIELLFEWDSSIPEWQKGDPFRINQIINNYLSNAIKFTERGSVTLKVTLHGNNIKLTVRDTGIGISPQGLEKLFIDFSQVDASTSRQFGGTGLGLAISKKLANLMGGDVGVSSEENQGSEFWVLIPNRPSEKVEKSEQTTAIQNPAVQSRHILLVDDNLINRQIGLKVLEKLGHKVELAENGKEAIALFLADMEPEIDLILMDCQMPEIDGFQTTIEIRKLNAKIPIIALTANTSEEDRQKAIESGMNDFLSKPFKVGDIQNIISSY